ncbi:MAG: biotin/lipoyl-binding protein [Lysobacterales bacterium]
MEEVLQLLGIVRHAPDRYWSITTRTTGKVLAVHVQVGDRVRKGDLLIDESGYRRTLYRRCATTHRHPPRRRGQRPG